MSRQLEADEWHRSHGAAMRNYWGWVRPAYYSPEPVDESAAVEREVLQVRSSAGVFDNSPLGKFLVRGIDAASLLDATFSGRPSSLPIGRARYAIMLSQDGVVLDDGIICRTSDTEYFVNTTSVGDLLFGHAVGGGKAQGEVSITRRTSELANLSVSGPRALETIEAALGVTLRVEPLHCAPAIILGSPGMVVRTRFCGEDTYELNFAPSLTAEALDRLTAASIGSCRPYGIEALNVLRLEGGHFVVGADTDCRTSVAELFPRWDRLGDPTPAPSPGGDSPRYLAGIVQRACDRPAAIGARIRFPRDAGEGVVTSSCFSPTLRRSIGLARMTGPLPPPGAEVEILDDEVLISATLTPRDFLRRAAADTELLETI